MAGRQPGTRSRHMAPHPPRDRVPPVRPPHRPGRRHSPPPIDAVAVTDPSNVRSLTRVSFSLSIPCRCTPVQRHGSVGGNDTVLSVENVMRVSGKRHPMAVSRMSTVGLRVVVPGLGLRALVALMTRRGRSSWVRSTGKPRWPRWSASPRRRFPSIGGSSGWTWPLRADHDRHVRLHTETDAPPSRARTSTRRS
jgi:hypothetical protein